MGMDARADIWVGLNINGRDSDSLGIPAEQKEELENVGETEVDGVKLKFFEQGEEDVGFGTQLLSHDWDYGVKELDLPDLMAKARQLTIQIEQIFTRWGIAEKPKVFLLTDFS